jgi:hypothetical protein
MMGLAAGRRERVMPSLTMRTSQSTGAPLCRACAAASAMPGENATCGASSTMPAAWIMRTTTRSSTGVKRPSAASRRMVAKDCR